MQVQTKDNWKLVVFFDNKNSKEIDCTFLLDYPAFEKLKDPTFFNQAFIHHGTVCWPDNIDLNLDWLEEKLVTIIAEAKRLESLMENSISYHSIPTEKILFEY